jgi:hypothetical protein
MNRFFEKPGKPLAVLAALITFLTSVYATMSGPVADALPVARTLQDLSEVSRDGRVILVYHTLAVPFVALLAIMYVGTIALGEGRRNAIVHALFFGSLVASLAGFAYGYLGGGMIAHGLYVFGLSVVFYGGLNLTLAVFQVRNGRPDASGSRDEPGSLEQLATGLTFAATLVSAAIGGAVGAFFGTGLARAFLAEDIIRLKHDIFMRAVISHLHIMLTLVAAAILVLIARFYRYREPRAAWFYRLVIGGVIVTSLATWSVIIEPIEKQAHKVINIGAVFLLAAAALLAIAGLARIAKRLFHHPFAAITFAYLLLVNGIVTVPGVYVAINLERFRTGEYAEVERSFATGHWHVLGGLCALMALLLLLDYLDVREAWARALAWSGGVSSLVAFGAANAYLFRAPGATGSIALAVLEPALAVFLIAAVVLVFRAVVEGIRSGPAWGAARSRTIDLSGTNS